VKYLKWLTHPLTVCNLIVVGSLGLIEILHINYHKTAPPCPVEQMEDDW